MHRVEHFSLRASRRIQYPLAILELARLLRRHSVDVLQTHLFDAGVVGVLAGKLARVPLLVVTRHHTDQIRLAGTPLHSAVDRWMSRSADRVIAVSKAVKDYMVTSEGAGEDRVEVIHLGFDFDSLTATPEETRRAREELSLDSAFVVGCIASFFKTKGHEYLLRALRDLGDRIPNLRLLLIGGGDRDHIDKMIRTYDLQGKVIFGGNRNDVPVCISVMDVVVHPSLSEAFSQVIVETMAGGTALVTTDVGGAREVVTNGQTGFLIPAADTGAIAHSILDLYRNADKRNEVAAAGRDHVRRSFTASRMVQEQVAFYHRWLSRNGSWTRSCNDA